MKYLLFLFILCGCSNEYSYTTLEKFSHDWSKAAWTFGAMCERCDWYKEYGYPNNETKEICKKYTEKSSTAGFESWFSKEWAKTKDKK